MEHYLQRYAEPEVQLLSTWPDLTFNHTLVVPCYREKPDFLLSLERNFSGAGLLLILVVNQPDTDDGDRNDPLLDAVKARETAIWQSDHLSLRHWGDNGGLLLVERWRDGLKLPRQQGVGLARKIGCDIAAQLTFNGCLSSGWIHSTDADTRLPADYFQGLPDPIERSAAIYPFTHEDGPALVHRAHRLYEGALQHYVDGLRWAGSPWAFHTIGSTLAISAHHYCAARGFPRRAAGEDFYLLNKLAKLAPVTQFRQRGKLVISARLSQRVPFGTGPATARIAAQLEAGEEPLWYAPQVFSELQKFLTIVRNSGPPDTFNEPWAEIPIQLGWSRFVRHCRQQKLSPEQQQQALKHWFDAFRTLRFVHLVQKHLHPPLPLRTLLDNPSPFDHLPTRKASYSV
ncbi:hypothetical protein [Microbulbifer discodermiae]|uniref:hypothetical protein n=1 Tax=Microbulbifer sp. 2201CG32-9 TaxID=3232309 RepID=UPI00345B5884